MEKTQKISFDIDAKKHMVLKHKAKTKGFDLKEIFRKAVEEIVTDQDVEDFKKYARGI